MAGVGGTWHTHRGERVNPAKSVIRAMSALSRSRPAVVIVIAVAAVLANVVQFRAIDRSTPDNVRAIHHPGTADLLQLMYHGCSGRCIQRYGMQMALGLIAPGARVIIPTPSPILADPDTEEEFLVRLRAFGAVDRIERVRSEVAAEILAAVDPDPFIIASGPGGTFGDAWAIAVDPASAPTGGVRDPGGYLRQAVMSGRRPSPGARPREFVIVRWERGRAGSGGDQTNLVLETSLLPVSVYAGLNR